MFIVWQDNSIAYFSNTYFYEYDNDLIDNEELDLSEEVKYPFQNINPTLQKEIKFLFNYHRDFDGKDFSFEYFVNKAVEDVLIGWRSCFEYFVNTCWEEKREEIIKVCIDYAETCLAFHRENCHFCDEFGDCTATSIWKYRIGHSAITLNLIKPNYANNILLKYQGITFKPTEKSLTPILKYNYVDKAVETLKDYFNEDNATLKKVLTNYTVPTEKLLFNGNGNLLGDFFKQLYDSGFIVGKKYELIAFIKSSFKYKHAGNIKEFTDKYLSKLIESNEITCKTPITNVKKW